MHEKASWGFGEGAELAPGRYVSRLLGGGTRYEAYLAWDDELHTLVVAKALRPSHVHDPGARAGLEREARTLAALDHPVLVRAFGAVLDGDHPHLVLEYLDGPRLSTLLRRYGVVVSTSVGGAPRCGSVDARLSARWLRRTTRVWTVCAVSKLPAIGTTGSNDRAGRSTSKHSRGMEGRGPMPVAGPSRGRV